MNSAQKETTPRSIRSIRWRLWLLLLRAFVVVVLLILVLIISATFLLLGRQTNANPYYRAPVAALLETYYLGHGGWQGVEDLLDGSSGINMTYLQGEWNSTVLLDRSGRVVLDRGQVDSPRMGEIYAKSANERRLDLLVGGQIVGALIFENSLLSSPLRLGLSLLPSIVPISILLGLLTLVIGFLLMRRVVDPLAEVIAAAQRVAEGDLSARAPVSLHRDDIHALSASFNQMADSLERSDNQRRAMLADVAHELRTPLSILRGRLEGILDGIYAADQAHIAPALEEVYLLDRLVDDLRILTLAEARQLPLEIRPFDLVGLADKVVCTFEAEAEELTIQLETNFTPQDGEITQANVLGDAQRIEQVIGNLIGNALRYIPSGSRVRVQVKQENQRGSLAVSDNGPGIAEEDLPYVFDRFWRGDKSRARAAGGAGLGLAISRQLIEAMGGEISASNHPERGFVISFWLPAA